jgi:YVTN family beta-propeller protein
MRSIPCLAALAPFAALALGIGENPARAEPPKLEVQEVAETGAMPKGATLSPDGTRFFVTNFGQANGDNIRVYDTATLAKVATIDLAGIVVETVLSPDGNTIYASNFQRGSVMFIDVKTRRKTREVTAGMHPKILALSTDGAMLFVANWSGHSVTQVDTSNGKIVRTLATGLHPRGMVVAKDGTLYVANFDGASLEVYENVRSPLAKGQKSDQPDTELVHRHLAACQIPRHLALSPDESRLYVSCFHDSTLDVLDRKSEAVVRRVPVGSSPKSIQVSNDGRYVYSADYGKETNSVSVVDTTDWTTRIFEVPGMDRGSGIAVLPDGAHALVTGWYDNHVYLVGFEGTGGHPHEALGKIGGWIAHPHHVDPPTAGAGG